MNGVEFLTRLVPALAVVLAIPLAAMWWQRSRGGSQRQAIRVTAKTPIGRNSWIAIVEVDARRFLVSSAERGMSLLSELDTTPPDVEQGTAADAAQTSSSAWNAGTTGPRTGLIRRMQERTLRRTSADRGSDVELEV